MTLWIDVMELFNSITEQIIMQKIRGIIYNIN